MKNIFFLLLLASSTFVAQTSTDLFDKANAAYKETKYQEAIDLYIQIEEQNLVSSTLYYNLGNCYYKLNKVANTIYYYEKALLLNPLNSDARNNLEFAKRMTIDRIEELPKSFSQRLEINYIQKFSYNQWALITVICSFLTAFLFLLFYFSRASHKKRAYFLSSVLLLILCVVSTTITYNQYHSSTNTKFAIIFASKVVVKNAPTDTASEIFTLHEGTKINVLDAVDTWKKIRLVDGKIGWISADALKEI
ncbi:MAG: tetratricopeptide repeat protein [Polaribacter sp.]|nr:tetratricopeptide repeat protein [Polaribacter sp.]